MATFDGAFIKEQGVTFAIVVVKPSVLNSSSKIEEARESFQRFFPNVPVVLMAQNSSGTPRYQGRTDIVKFLENIHPNRIPWKRYTY